MRWVVRIATKWLRLPGHEMKDMSQNGALGLMKAIEKFDLSSSARFLTYATHVVRDQITKSSRDQFHLVHVPQWAWVIDAAHQKAARAMNLDPLATHDAVEERVNSKIKKRKTTACNARGTRLARQGVRLVLSSTRAVYEPDVKEEMLADLPERRDEPEIDEGPDPRLVPVRKAMDCLSDKQRLAVMARFGIDGMSTPALVEQSGDNKRSVSYNATRGVKELRAMLTTNEGGDYQHT
jgi:RNA polymerase sigma factor (sigma-70 family)